MRGRHGDYVCKSRVSGSVNAGPTPPPPFTTFLIDPNEALALAQARMKIWYDEGKKPQVLDQFVYLRLAKLGQPGYHVQNQSKLSVNRLGPLRIIRPVGDLAYEVQLPEWLTGVHPVISVEWLEPVVPDPFVRLATLPLGPLRIDEEGGKLIPKFIVQRIVAKRRFKHQGNRGFEVQYLVKWLGEENMS